MFRFKNFVFFCVLFFFFSCVSPSFSRGVSFRGRVAVRLFSTKNVDRVEISSENLRIGFADGSEKVCRRAVFSLAGAGGKISVDCGGDVFAGDSPISVKSGCVMAVAADGACRYYNSPLFLRNTGSRFAITSSLDLEDYVAGVLFGEMSTSGGEIEAAKALSVAIRSYTLANLGRHKKEGFDFCDSTHCQYFPGCAPKNSEAYVAAMFTRGLVLSKGGEIVPGFYHSTCGGFTSGAGEVFGGNSLIKSGVRDRLRGDREALCKKSPHFSWKCEISGRDLEKLLRSEADFFVSGSLKSVKVAKRDSGGRVKIIKIRWSGGERSVLGYDFYQMMGGRLGWGKFKSSFFQVRKKGSLYVFEGFGLGHGVGLCQFGALEMARRGKSFGEILKHYYPGAHLMAIPLSD